MYTDVVVPIPGMIPPGFPVEKWYHPVARPNANGTFAELAAEWYKSFTGSGGNSLGQGVSYDAFGPPDHNYPQLVPWPANPATGLVEIKYCYQDQGTKDRAHGTLEMAIQFFEMQMLGGPSANTGYSIKFSEVRTCEMKINITLGHRLSTLQGT